MEYTGILSAALDASSKLATLKCIHKNINNCFDGIVEASNGGKNKYVYVASWRATVSADQFDAQKAFVRDMIIKVVKHYFPDIETQVIESLDLDSDKNWTLQIKFSW